MRALFFTAWSTKRGTALPMQKKFLLVSVSVRIPHYLDVFSCPADSSIGDIVTHSLTHSGLYLFEFNG